MSSASKWLVFAVLCSSTAAFAAPTLRVCADPNNLPFSNQAQQGFENRIAASWGKISACRFPITGFRSGRRFSAKP